LSRKVPIIQFGLGGVGRALLRQIIEKREYIAQRNDLEIEIVALLDSSGGIWAPSGLDEQVLRQALAAKSEELSLQDLPSGRSKIDDAALVTRVAVAGVKQAVVVDVTADPGLQEALLAARRHNYSLVLSNKYPLSSALKTFRRLASGGGLRYEATVGAGLPVIATLQYLLDSGDEVTSVAGSISGTLGLICTRLQEEVPFSQALAEARQLGYTEPDPRQDLRGMDVARKLVILARTLGWKVELADVEVEGLYPSNMDNLSLEEFMGTVSALDDSFALRAAEARDKGCVLRYLGELRDGRCRVGLKEVPAQGHLGALRGSDSLFLFHSTRYADRPLVISGPGAGVEVTAAAVLADIIDVARISGQS
jgi:homoserine dehydrogenase